MITITNPETGAKHQMDHAAMEELEAAYEAAKKAERTELVFRAMRIDMRTAASILATDT